jgi:hypothetical protein
MIPEITRLESHLETINYFISKLDSWSAQFDIDKPTLVKLVNTFNLSQVEVTIDGDVKRVRIDTGVSHQELIPLVHHALKDLKSQLTEFIVDFCNESFIAVNGILTERLIELADECYILFVLEKDNLKPVNKYKYRPLRVSKRELKRELKQENLAPYVIAQTKGDAKGERQLFIHPKNLETIFN